MSEDKPSILDTILKQQQNADKIQALLKLLEIYDIDITIAGDKSKVLNLELITEYTSPKIVSALVKNETWRRANQEVLHMKDINQEKIVGTMDTQYILKMNSNKRKREQSFVNALRNDKADAEVIPTNTRRRRFFGLG